MSAAWTLGLEEAARAIRDGGLTSLDCVGACLGRVSEVEPAIAAWAFLDHDHALAQARAADDHRMHGRDTGPLHGVPVGISDVLDTGDYPTELGSPIQEGRTPRRDCVAVARVRSAGAVVLGKTATSAYAIGRAGRTRNPHDPNRTPGGASGGAAAAVASAMVPGSISLDPEATTIVSAALCGVVGYLPTHGLIPRSGALTLSRTLDRIGVLARGVEDVALLASVLAGFDADDPDTRPIASPAFVRVAASEPPLPPRLAFMRTPAWPLADADTRAAFDELAATLGDTVSELELGASFAVTADRYRVVLEVEVAHNLGRDVDLAADGLGTRIRSIVERGRRHAATDYTRALADAAALNRALDEVFDHYDAILAPCASGEAPLASDAIEVNTFTALWSYLGVPAIALPLMRSERGLPLGAVLVGRRDNDARLMRTARWLTTALSRGSNGRRRASPRTSEGSKKPRRRS